MVKSRPSAKKVALPPDETFEALIFDWDGTAVADRQVDATGIRTRVERMCAAGVHVFVVSGTHVGNIDGQLKARPQGRGRLHLCCNRGSEVFEVTNGGPTPMFQRAASADEDDALDRAAEQTVERLRTLGLETKVVSSRLNRRKIDLIPLPHWADPKKADIALLADAVAERLSGTEIGDLAGVIALAGAAAHTAGLSDPRITSDVKHVEIGLTDKSDAADYAASWLADRGITGELVLIAGDEFGSIGGIKGSDSYMMVENLARAAIVSVGIEPGGVPDKVMHIGGGPAEFADVLDGQLRRRAEHRVPQIDLDPAWVLPLPAARARERVAEALGTLGNGMAGLRAAREEDGVGTSTLFLVGGVYTGDGHLLAGPIWTGLDLPEIPHRRHDQRWLDLRTGALVRTGANGAALRTMRFVSAAAPHVMAMRAEALPSDLEPGDALRPPADADGFERQSRDRVHLARTGQDGCEIALAARTDVREGSGRRVVERLVAWVAASTGGASFDDASDRLVELGAPGFDALLAEHREAWARRWADAEVVIEGDPESELAARFAVFHLLSAVSDTGEAGVGARGLTGDAYAGHVFWDADVFVLPALAAIRPSAARAMLEYRVRRLPAARAVARVRGLRGARFPWESAGDGRDVTPRSVPGHRGELIPIATGVHEEHIVADVAWAAAHYTTWTGDTAFLTGPGRDLVVDTARYWASRIRRDGDGTGHLCGVMGPDEYHQVVDDNAYTNVMARWNLRRGADLLAHEDRDSREPADWRDLANCLVDGWNPDRSLYEQFAGYFELEPLLISQVASPPVVADVLLGPQRVAGSQLIKQADVLMLHHLVPEEVVAGSLDTCLSFYEPRTAHGSSLSPAISATLLARAGHPERALELFRIAARLDLDDLTKTTAGGLHLATMGGVWQALAWGFLGLHCETQTLEIDPCLPQTWDALGLRLHFQGHRIGIRAEHDRVTITCDAPLLVRIADGSPQRCEPPGVTVSLAPTTTERSHP